MRRLRKQKRGVDTGDQRSSANVLLVPQESIEVRGVVDEKKPTGASSAEKIHKKKRARGRGEIKRQRSGGERKCKLLERLSIE